MKTNFKGTGHTYGSCQKTSILTWCISTMHNFYFNKSLKILAWLVIIKVARKWWMKTTRTMPVEQASRNIETNLRTDSLVVQLITIL